MVNHWKNKKWYCYGTSLTSDAVSVGRIGWRLDGSPYQGRMGYYVEYLEKLRTNNVRMCIASASPVSLIEAMIKRHKIVDYFDFMCSTEDGFPDKRHPDIYLYCAEKFKSAPPATAVFEDSYSAIKTAKKANFHVVAVYDETQKNYWREITETADVSKISFL